MYLQTFNNNFLKRVFIFVSTSKDTDSYSRSYAWKPQDSVKYCKMECIKDHNITMFQTWNQDSAFQWFN